MAITNYTELQAAIIDMIARSDLTAEAPEWIALCEADMRRKLQDVKSVASVSMVAGTASLAISAGVKSIEALTYNTSSLVYGLTQKSMAGLAQVRRTGTGIPAYFAVVGTTMYFDVAPSDNYALQMTYIGQPTALAGGNPTNSTLTNSPDLYLYGSLLHAAPYLEHDERIATWRSFYDGAILEENIYRERSEFGASPEMQLPMAFGEETGL
jgi:hypothetical protein